MIKSRRIISKKLGLSVVGFIVIILIVIYEWVSSQSSLKIVRQIDSSSDHLQSLWVIPLFLNEQDPDLVSNTVYAYLGAILDNLIALDGNSGSTIWKTSLQENKKPGEFNQNGPIQIWSTDQTVITLTPTGVNAYRSSTGEWLWFTKLGDGHVSMYAQKEDALLRVYYGEKIFEISQGSGKILNVLPIDNIIWIQNNVEIHRISTDPMSITGMIGIDHITGRVLWTNNGSIFFKDSPIPSIGNIIFVHNSDLKICALLLDSGEYSWCRPEEYVSNLGVDQETNIGYVLNSSYNLVKIDLRTGNILAGTQFLPKILPADSQGQGYGYTIAVTKNMVIVSFGDSGQTFGLKILP